MNGADRFQLFFDRITRRTTGCGNVIRARITIDGIIPENHFRELINSNKALRFLAGRYPKREWYSTIYRWKVNKQVDTSRILSIHSEQNAEVKIQQLLATDCTLKPGDSIKLAVVYQKNERTHIIISVNHSLLDYAGMENLIASVAGISKNIIPEKQLKSEGTFIKKFKDTVSATAYVASRTSWNLRRLNKNIQQPKHCIEVFEFTTEESSKIKQHLQNEIKSTALPFFVAVSLAAIHNNKNLLTDKSGDFFIAVPLDRRPASHKNVLTGNYLSFVYFHKADSEMSDIRSLTVTFGAQMIQQARKAIPEKFISLLELFRFLPPAIYWAWMNLPTKGNSTSFALSLLSNSALEKNTFMGFKVIDVTHYPPVISPPGLNIVFTEFRSQLKIIISYDEKRISKSQIQDFIIEVRKNLLN